MMHRTLRLLAAAEGGAGFYLLGSRTINAGVVAPLRDLSADEPLRLLRQQERDHPRGGAG